MHEPMVASEPVKNLLQEWDRVSDNFVKCVEEGMSALGVSLAAGHNVGLVVRLPCDFEQQPRCLTKKL